MWGQSSALVDPASDLKWIHQIQRLRCSGIGYLRDVGTAIPCGVKSELGARGHAYLVMRNLTENDGAGRGTITVDDHHRTRAAHALKFIEYVSIRPPGSCAIRTAASLAPIPASRITATSNTARPFMTIPSPKLSVPNLTTSSDASLSKDAD
jgi:hypothetical protein